MSGPERARRAVVIVAAAISALAVILFLGALRNDLTIRSDTGTAVARCSRPAPCGPP